MKIPNNYERCVINSISLNVAPLSGGKFVKKNTKNNTKKKCVSKCSSEWWKTAAEVPFPPQVPAIYHSTIP